MKPAHDGKENRITGGIKKNLMQSVMNHALEKLLSAYGQYYNVERDRPAPPFTAEAVFHSHEEQYFLIRAARIAEADSHEYVFFALENVLTPERLQILDAAAWETGLARVNPHADHRNTDITLIILAERIPPETQKQIRRRRHYKSYAFRLRGWSQYSLFAVEVPTGGCFWNREGQRLKKVIQGNISGDFRV